MGKEGIIPEHPTLKLKYLDEGMAELALELREKLEAEREMENGGERVDDAYRGGVSNHAKAPTVGKTIYHDEPRKPR